MLFLTSLLYCLLCFVLPGELVLGWLAFQMRALPFWLSLALLNALVYASVLIVVRLMHWGYAQTDLYGQTTPGHEPQPRRLRQWLRISGGQWIGAVGLVALGLGAAVVALADRLPQQCLYLFGAVALGLADVARRDFLLPVPSDLPDPRFDFEQLRQRQPPLGKKMRFCWPMPAITAGPPRATCEVELLVDQDELNQAQSRPSCKSAENLDLIAHLREGFGPTIQWAVVALREQSLQLGLGAVEEILNVVAFVRSLDQGDHTDLAVPKLPVQTLSDGGGRPSDLAVLAAALLHLLGHDVALFLLSEEAGEHMAIGYQTDQAPGLCSARAADGREYAYLETTPGRGSGWVGSTGIALLADPTRARVLPLT